MLYGTTTRQFALRLVFLLTPYFSSLDDFFILQNRINLNIFAVTLFISYRISGGRLLLIRDLKNETTGGKQQHVDNLELQKTFLIYQITAALFTVSA